MEVSERNYMSKQLNTLLLGVERNSSVCSQEIISCALYLLQNVPASRQAVLEYLSMVFEEAASIKLLHDSNQKGIQVNDLENLIGQCHDVLQRYIKKYPAVWTPVLSKWSIELLGRISIRVRQGNQQSLALNDQLQQWMTCHPTNTLIQIASDCLAAMVGSTPEVCVDALLEASVKYAPHFDWVVAHIGSCFPQTVIQRVLLVGLEEFHSHTANQQRALFMKIPKLDSVVSILAHLAGHHAADLHQAMLALFQESLKAENSRHYQYIVPYLLRLGFMSHILLRALTANVTRVLTVSVIAQLCQNMRGNSPADVEQLISLVVQLVRRCTQNTYDITMLLMNIAAKPVTPKNDNSMDTDEVLSSSARETCAYILNALLLELQRCIHRQGSDGFVEVPFLRSIMSNGVLLTKQLVLATDEKQWWLSRLVACIGLHSSQHETAVMLASLLMSSANHKQLNMVLDLHQELCIRYPQVFQEVLIEVLNQLKSPVTDSSEKSRTINNLEQLVCWEQMNDKRFCGFSIVQCLQNHLLECCHLLVQDSGPEAVRLLQTVGLSDNLNLDTMVLLRENLLKAFISALTIAEHHRKIGVCSACIELLQKLCRLPSVMPAVSRFLLEIALSEEYRELFGGSPPEVVMTPASSLSLTRSLEKSTSSRLKDSCLTPMRPIGLHDGVVGKGVKPTVTPYKLSKDEIVDNQGLLVNAIWTCCVSASCVRFPLVVSPGSGSRPCSPAPSRSQAPSPKPTDMDGHCPSPSLGTQTVDGKSRVITADVGRELSLIVVELITPDVMYNGIMWPDEEFMKVTTERDLQIKRTVEKNPVIWQILSLLIQAPGALCYCSVILRSLMATLINHWETSRHQSALESANQLTVSGQLISLLRQGGMLPPPLNYIGEVLEYLTPYEVHLLLLTVWKYMKENPPDPRKSRTGCDPRYTETLRHIFQSNIAKMGHLYPRIFPQRGNVA